MSAASCTAERIVLAPEARRAAVLDVIGSARKRLILSLYRCDDRKVLEALRDARRRGVQVEALLTRRGGCRSSLRLLRLLLESFDVTVRRYGDRSVKYHAKYVVADARRAIVGSLNFTRACFRRTSDFLLDSSDADLAAGLTVLFETDCDAQVTTRPRGLPSRLIVGPEDARPRMVALLGRARQRIQLVDPKLSDPAILAILDARVAAGVQLDLLDDRVIGGRRSHGKLLIVDNRVAVLGSMGLSASNLDRRREVAVIVDDPSAVRRLQRIFRRPVLAPRAGQMVVVGSAA